MSKAGPSNNNIDNNNWDVGNNNTDEDNGEVGTSDN